MIVNLNMNKTKIIIFITAAILAVSATVTAAFVISKKHSANRSENTVTQTSLSNKSKKSENKARKSAGTESEISEDGEDVFEDEEHLRSKSFEITNFTETSVMTDSPIVNFRGTGSPFYPITYNGNKIDTADNGDFSVDINLNRGINRIVFEHKGEKYEYSVTYNMNIIETVSPSENISVPSGMTVDIYATALNGSDLRVTFGGQTVRMTAGEEAGDEEFVNPAGFSTYKASVKAPDVSSETNTGRFKVTATNGGMTQSKSGASITVTPVQKIKIEKVRTTAPRRSLQKSSASAPSASSSAARQSRYSDASETGGTSFSVNTPSTRVPHGKYAKTTTSTAETEEYIPGSVTESENYSEEKRLQKYSYNSDYGLGTAEMIEITDNYAEVYPGSNMSTLSSPDYSPQLKGTVDYITSKASIDNTVYYFTNSGFKVPLTRDENAAGGKTKITHLKTVKGFVMPSNNVKVLSCKTEGGTTVIRFDLNRKVPFNVRLTGQSYLDNGAGRIFKVTSPDFKGLQIKFYDTVSITGSFDFSGGILGKGTPSVSSGEVSVSIPVTSSKRFKGWHCRYDEQGCLELTVYAKPTSISGYTVMLDAGHGGYDGGASCAVSPSAWNEQKLNLSIASKIKTLLENEGAKVIMTRSDSSFLSLTGRTDKARRYIPDIFISIHCDASSSAGAYGTSAYYYRTFSQPLAKSIHNSLVSCWKNSIYAGMNRPGCDRGSMFAAYRVTRIEECPSVLIEYGFVTNPVECQALESSTNRDLLAKATVTGIKNYIASGA